jgi:hypothetical protein
MRGLQEISLQTHLSRLILFLLMMIINDRMRPESKLSWLMLLNIYLYEIPTPSALSLLCPLEERKNYKPAKTCQDHKIYPKYTFEQRLVHYGRAF